MFYFFLYEIWNKVYHAEEESVDDFINLTAGVTLKEIFFFGGGGLGGKKEKSVFFGLRGKKTRESSLVCNSLYFYRKSFSLLRCSSQEEF